MGNTKTTHTPGPWRWELNEQAKCINLCGGIPRYDLTVMDFTRYGMSGAAPRFNTTHKAGYNIMERADTMSQIVPGREHHANWFQNIDHPDARLIAAAPELLEALVETRLQLSRLKLSILAHPDCTEGSEFDDLTNSAQEAEDMASVVISKALGEEEGNG